MTEPSDWEAKHRAQSASSAGEPDPFVVRALDLLGPGDRRRAWDLAAGRGRHTLELARRGYRVTAFDRSAEALAQVSNHAVRADLRPETRLADLESTDWWTSLQPPDLIVVVNYLDRALLDRLPTRLAPNGHLLFVTFTVERPGEHPSARWCLDVGELATRFCAAHPLLSEEHSGRAGILTQFGDKLE